MKTMKSTPSFLVCALLLGVLSSCTAPGAGPHRMQHPGAAAAAGTPEDPAYHARAMKHDDMMAMCSGVRHRLRAATSAAERAAIMQEHMKTMPPDMRKKMDEHMRSLTDGQRAHRCMQAQ